MNIRFHFLLLFFIVSSLEAADLKKVSFFHDKVFQIDGKIIKFLSGSTWVMEREIVALPLGEGVVVCAGPAPEFTKDRMDEYLKALPNDGVLIYKGNAVKVTRVDGLFLLKNGSLGKVIEKHGDGAILKTEDGSLWAIPSYDQYDTGYWVPPYPVLIFGGEQYLINLNEGKRVSIEKRVK